MKLSTHGRTLILTGRPDEFAEFIGWPDYEHLSDVLGALKEMVGTANMTITAGPHLWNVRGHWENFAELIGLPEASTKEEVVEAVRSLHKDLFSQLR